MKGEHKPTFLDNVILDVTNFEAMSPDEPVGISMQLHCLCFSGWQDYVS